MLLLGKKSGAKYLKYPSNIKSELITTDMSSIPLVKKYSELIMNQIHEKPAKEIEKEFGLSKKLIRVIKDNDKSLVKRSFFSYI